MDDPFEQAMMECYREVAGGVEPDGRLLACVKFWAGKCDPRYTLMLFGFPGREVSAAVLDRDTELVVTHDRKRVPLHIFLFLNQLPLLALFNGRTYDAA
jgi:hypothetical protein